MFDISYLVLQNACGAQQRSVGRRRLFFDLGSSEYTGSRVNLTHGDGRFSSIPLFHALYARNCIVFNGIFAWEYTQFLPSSYWQNVPADMKAIVHFYNEPVTRVGTGLADFNVLRVLEQAATPEDFVAIKVDVDHGDIEVQLVTAIAQSPRLSRLVDEILFEYHFDVRPCIRSLDHAPASRRNPGGRPRWHPPAYRCNQTLVGGAADRTAPWTTR